MNTQTICGDENYPLIVRSVLVCGSLWSNELRKGIAEIYEGLSITYTRHRYEKGCSIAVGVIVHMRER